jgi:hypothetical protein
MVAQVIAVMEAAMATSLNLDLKTVRLQLIQRLVTIGICITGLLIALIVIVIVIVKGYQK